MQSKQLTDFVLKSCSRNPIVRAGLGGMSVVGVLAVGALMLPGTASARPELTVLQELGGSQNWSEIVRQLEQSEFSYSVLDERGFSLDALRNVEVLFIPNVSEISDSQLQVLEVWMQTGNGRLIVSGPMRDLSPNNQRRLRQLLGGYWGSDREETGAVVATSFRGNDWTETVQAETPIVGGSLIPSGLDSKLTATWSGEMGSPVAVISTRQSVYLGWEWGASAASDVNEQWLAASLDRFDEGGSVTTTATRQEEVDDAAETRAALDPAPPVRATEQVDTDVAAVYNRQSSSNVLATDTAGLDSGSDRTVSAPTSTSQLDITQFARPSTGSTSATTSEVATAPATEPFVSSLPINTLEMLAMRSELSSLLGRVESAMLTTDAAGLDGSGLPDQYRNIIEQARLVESDIDDWVNSGQHERARREHAMAISNLWESYPRDRLTALPEVRAIWLDRGTIVDARSPAGLAEVFDRLASAGINTVFFETINAGFPVYPSRIAPAQNPLTRGWDPLAAAVELAHERDMELHAWMWTFAVGNSRHNVLPEIGFPQDYVGPVLTAHPGWSSYDARGRQFPSGQPETWLDPANDQARNYLISLMREMVSDYGVDGIHLDYIRYPFQSPGSRLAYGYGRVARQKFQQLTGVDPQELDPNRDRSLWAMWTEFKSEQVSTFVAEAADTMQALDPQVVMSAAVYPMPYNERMQKLQQEWETWIARGDLDLLVPMTYVENSRRMEQLVRPALEATSSSSVLLRPSFNLLDMPEVEFLDSMQAVRDLPTGGYSLFAARHLNGEFQTILNQSRIPSSQIPYRAPFSASIYRFNALQQEWETLLANEQMWIPDRFQEDWRTQVAQVDAALQALDAAPSAMALNTARQELAALLIGMEEWFRFEALERPYRVNTWGNRLVALDTLLRYGEQRLPRLQSASSQ
ncbi:MAG: family 10 glycosylhydrolase [Cyanobacteria bacterium P01_E01_bin.34]